MRRIALLLLLAVPIAAQQAAPPPPAAPREAKLPQPVEKTLANGLRVIVVPKHDIPLVAARLLVRAGAAADPNDRAGLAHLTATVLTKGTKTRPGEQIARGVEALGATMSAEAGWDHSAIDLSVMSSHLSKAMEFVSDVARNPTFAKGEFDRERAQALDALQVSLGEPRALASAVAARLIFGESPYGHHLEGTPGSLRSMTPGDLVRFHAAHYRPDNAVLVIAGDVKADDAFALAQSAFGSWKKPAKAMVRVTPAVPKARAGRVVVIDMPEAGQSAVVIGRTGIQRSDPRYMSATVANSILGAGYSSRLNQEIRIKRGLAYGAASSFQARAGVGPFLARTETKHETAAEAASIIVGEMKRLGSADVPENELTPRKAVLIGEFGQALETTAGIVNRVSSLALYGLPLSEINRFVSSVQAVSAADVRKFAASNLSDAGVNVVVVGDAKVIVEPLQKELGEVEVIPAADVDLSSATLRVRKAKR